MRFYLQATSHFLLKKLRILWGVLFVYSGTPCYRRQDVLGDYSEPSNSRHTQHQKSLMGGFPGGAVVGNLPASAGDTGSSLGLGGSHVPRSD